MKIPYVNEKQEMLNVGENGKASMTLDALEVGACAIIDGAPFARYGANAWCRRAVAQSGAHG